MARRKKLHLSQALHNAQEDLEMLRARVQANRPDSDKSFPDKLPRSTKVSPAEETFSCYPAHLGWGSEPLTSALRSGSISSSRGLRPVIAATDQKEKSFSLSTDSIGEGPALTHPSITIYPDLALGMLKNKQVAAGRIWLLLKFIDVEGRGWFKRGEVDRLLAHSDSEYRVCGRRQLRKLLSKGDGFFWQRAGGRLWLRSSSKAAVKLGVQRLSGHPVSLPLEILLRRIGQLRAHLYGCFHSGHAGKNGLSKPIARSTLKEISSVSTRTQRMYELRAGIVRQKNIIIGDRVKRCELEYRAWRHGRALFIYKDHSGSFGSVGASYTAWQLPNSYRGPHDIQPKGRQKAINREIADLFTKGITGNSALHEHSRIHSFERLSRRYFKNGQTAAKLYNLDPGQDKYWKGNRRSSSSEQIWHVFSGQEVTVTQTSTGGTNLHP